MDGEGPVTRARLYANRLHSLLSYLFVVCVDLFVVSYGKNIIIRHQQIFSFICSSFANAFFFSSLSLFPLLAVFFFLILRQFAL